MTNKVLGTPLLSSKTSPQPLNAHSTPEEFCELAQHAAAFLSTKADPNALRVVEEFPPLDQDILSIMALMRTGR